MKIGSVVKLVNGLPKRRQKRGYGIVINAKDWPESNSVWYTVHWQDGTVRHTYESDDLQVIA